MPGIMLNEDNTHFLFSRYARYGAQIPREEVEAFVDQYKGTDVTDLVFCIGANHNTNAPSKIVDSFAKKYTQTVEAGHAVDYSGTWLAASYDLLTRRGIDIYPIWIERARAAGICAWLSLRMNDCHCNGEETHALLTDYFHDNPQIRRVRHRAPLRYFDRCMDYALPEVRERMLAHIRELAELYDMDGLELDWQREIFCFAPGGEYEGIEIVNQFTRDVRTILDEAGKKRGHHIRLAARTLPDPEKALECGFDVMTWAREGLIDMIVPTPRWASTDSDIPVELWKRMLADYPVEIAPGIEILERSTPNHPVLSTTLQNVNALAAAYLSMGADRLYTFNYMDGTPDHPLKDNGDSLTPKNYKTLLRTLGSAEKAVLTERRHMMTYSDIGPEWFDSERQAPLPVTSANNADVKFLRLRVGKVPEGAKVELRVGADCGAMTLFVNSRKAEYLRCETVTPAYTANPAWVFGIENDGHIPPFLVVEVIAKEKPVTVDYLEAHIW